MNIKFITYSMSLILGFMMVFSAPLEAAYAAQSATLKIGSSGPDVPDLQYRLKTIGYFNTDVTTYFGTTTLQSLKRFQKEYGLAADGVAGKRTWETLKKVSVNKTELDLLARIIYAEARGESYKGQVAVGAVVMNRLGSSSFPNSIKEVIEQPQAFTAVDDGQYKLTPNKLAYQAAQEAVKGYDPTNGALYYFNPETATSDWIWSRKQTTKIGRHIFAI
ncbi:N-acetylmuramoyl-L-alanine amidase [Paenibacillus endophyticus]|uniref:N-acetylmuramoyl-L-alanine amidase n=1 Tax=Paenibacillus endophyticus TaxID=1294268 RepID=A0A7W5C5Q5_9BACL|nr:cell wall hydrolase [Paenibacillus endophyticus]MBB3151596.1 N-acetylmuramoyl-L-alanine amidase [Paenibacillus endophyticus]